MTSIQGLTGTTGTQAMMMRPPPGRGPDMQTAMKPVADLLGTSVDGLQQSLRNGQTLDQQATAKGVSHSDLVQAIAQGLKGAQGNSQNGTSATSPTSATGSVDFVAMAEQIASGTPPSAPPDGGGHHVHGTRPQTGVNTASGLNELATMLGVDSDALKTGLTSGTSLSQILADNGVSEQKLADTLLQGVTMDMYS